jgi:hypothetical protein
MITRLRSDGPTTVVRPLRLAREALDALNRRLSFRMLRLDTDCTALGLETVTGWLEARGALREAIADIPRGTIVSVVPGKIGATPFALALGETHPLAFVPSLAVAWRLRQRRLALPNGRNWRPASMFDFAVWQQGEKPSSVQAIANAAERLRVFAERQNVSYSGCFGEEGTAQALMTGLQQADLVRLACHGRIDIDAFGAELLVAIDESLPPSIVTMDRNSQAAGHIMSWRVLAGLERISPLILSGACSSGVALLHEGGERLGLERPFFMAGAIAFVAPQWPVPMDEIQQLNVAIAQAYIADPGKPLGVTVWEQVNDADGQRLSPLTRTAIGLFGDWL